LISDKLKQLEFIELRRKLCLSIGLGLFPCAQSKDLLSSKPIRFKLLPSDFDISQFVIKPPPVNNYHEALEVFSLKKLRSKERIHQINIENLNAIDSFWAIVRVSEEDYPALTRKVYNALSDVTEIILVFKEFFNRERPSRVISEIEPILPVPWHTSYPSGHATQATVIASILADFFPNYSGPLFELSKQVGFNREVAGLHYQSDTLAGIELGNQFIAKLGIAL